MARTTVAELRRELTEAKKKIEALEIENRRARRYIDATMAGIMHVTGIVRWCDSLREAFDRFASKFEQVALEGSGHAEALNGWIGEAMALKGQKEPAGGSDLPA